MAADLPAHEIDRAIENEIAKRLRGRQAGTLPVADDLTFEALGFASLDMLELVDSLETALSLNPFEGTLSLNDVRTVRDLRRAYHTSAGTGIPPGGGDDALLAGRERAKARRRL